MQSTSSFISHDDCGGLSGILVVQVSQQDKLIVTLTRQLHEKDELHRVTVTALRTELNTVKQELKRERIGREAVAVANQRADGI